jgi:hypothetical protein
MHYRDPKQTYDALVVGAKDIVGRIVQRKRAQPVANPSTMPNIVRLGKVIMM